jgi:competence protein ComEA
VKNWHLIAFGVLLGLLVSGVIWLASSPPRGHPIQLLPPPTTVPIQVHVTGEVKHPGVYSFTAGQRVQDAIQEAGGFTEGANVSAINLAAPLDDGMQIQVPALLLDPEGQGDGGDQRFASPVDFLVNINTATQAELEMLPEIGPSIAEDIITYRQQEGLFTSIEDIQKVLGIGPATYEAIKDLITVGIP